VVVSPGPPSIAVDKVKLAEICTVASPVFLENREVSSVLDAISRLRRLHRRGRPMIVRRRHVVQWVQLRQFPGIIYLGEKFEHMLRKHSAIFTLYAILPLVALMKP
jgi:hypothetical protein